MNPMIIITVLFAAANAGHLGVPLAYNGYWNNLGSAPLGHDGSVIDTPEVAHAKAVHFAEYAKAASAAAAPKYAGSYGWGPSSESGYYYGAAPLAADGHVIDTPEVAHAKAVHFAEYARAAAAAKSSGHDGSYGWGPSGSGYSYGAAPLAADGHVIDTPEVAHAKSVHFAEYAKAAAAAASAPEIHSNNGYEHHAAAPLGHDGVVVETAEVAQARAAHLAEHAKAASASVSSGYPAGPVYSAWSAPSVVYSGAYGYAAAPVGHDGTVVETPEVAHARAAHLAAHSAAAARAASAW